ncbi:B2 protein [Spatholobus suberectus]|nr:B2 protein [Spatholobus suberectus]
MDLATATGGSKTAEEICFVDFKRRSKVRKLGDENEIRSSNESEKIENLVLVQQKRRKLIRPNFSKSITSDDKGIDLGASQNLKVPSSLGRYNVKDIKESCCALVQTEDNIKADAEVQNIISQMYPEDKNSNHARGHACSEGGERATDSALAAFNDKSECLDSIKADAEVPNIVGRTHSEDKNSSHARGYVCGEGGEKSTDGAFTAFKDGSKCLENINQNVFASASCTEKSCHMKKGLCRIDGIKSASLNTDSLRSICQEHHVHKIICAGRGINTGKEMAKDYGSSCAIEVKDGSECLQNSGNEKAPIEISYPIKEGLHVMDNIKSVSAGTESVSSICQQHHTGKIICTGRGSNTKEMSKDGSSCGAGVKDGFDCLQKSNNENASIATYCFREGLCMTDGKKSVSPDSESLPSICKECHVDKIMCAGRAIKTEEGLSKDGRSSFTTEVKDGSDGSQNSANDNAPITTCEQKMA